MSLAPFPDFVRLAPTATKVPSDGADRVIVCGSHGGAYAGYLVAKSRAKAMILNDAAGGLDDAGFGSLQLAQSMDMAAATVSHASAELVTPRICGFAALSQKLITAPRGWA